MEVAAHLRVVPDEVARPQQQVVELGRAGLPAFLLEAPDELLGQRDHTGDRLGAQLVLGRVDVF